MAIGLDASGDRLIRTTDLPDYNAAYTCTLWFHLVAAPTADRDILTISYNSPDNQAASDAQDKLGVSNVPRFVRRINNASNSSFGPNPASTGQWYFVGMRRTSATSLVTFVDGTFGNVGTTDVSSRSAADKMVLGTRFMGLMNARFAALKFWTAALTDEEIANEMHTIRPQRTSDLYGWWPLFSHTDLADYSGNGRDWTAQGTLTTEDGPPVSWGASPIWVVQYAGDEPEPEPEPSEHGGTLTPTVWSNRRALECLEM